jgi:hypothetical protein
MYFHWSASPESMLSAPSFMMAWRRGLNHCFGRHLSLTNYDVIIICLLLTSPNSPRGSGPTVEVHYPGHPTCWFKPLGPTHLDYQIMLIWLITRIRTWTQGNTSPTELSKRIGDASSPSKDKTCKYHSFLQLTTSVLNLRTDDTFNQKAMRTPHYAGVMSAYHSWWSTIVIGRWGKVRQEQSTTSWDIMILQWSICQVILDAYPLANAMTSPTNGTSLMDK